MKLLRENFSPGDKLVPARAGYAPVYAMGYIGAEGKHKLLLVNKRNRPFEVTVPGGAGASVEYVDQSTGNNAPVSTHLTGDTVSLGGLGVAVVTLAK